MAKSFFDFFPTPKFLEMPAPGLALTDSGLKFIEFGSGPQGEILKRYGSTELPDGLIENGNIKDKESLTRALEDFRKSFNLTYIRTSLPEEKAYLFQTSVPNVPAAELRTVVESVIEENVPLSVAEIIFDYHVLAPKGANPTDKITVSVSVIPESLVLEYLDVFRTAGLMPLHFDVESRAVAKALVSKDDPGVSLIVNLNRTKAGLYIISQGLVSFTSTVAVSPPAGGKDVPQEVRGVQGEVELAKDDATLLVAYPGLETLKSEIEKIFLYWQAQSDRQNRKNLPIGKIILCGDEAGRAGVASYLSRELDIEVLFGNVWGNVFSFDQYIPDISFADSLMYACAVGLALSHQDEI